MRFSWLALAVGLALVGCGGDGNEGAPSSSSGDEGSSSGAAGSSGSPGGSSGTVGPDGGSSGLVTGNGIKDGSETDVDCGGGAPGVPPCADAKACVKASDCAHAYCTNAGVCATPTGTDAVKNGDESDVDCGGTTTGAPRCAATRACNGGPDCDSAICEDGTCTQASDDDGVKNGDESDVDCGGTTTGARKCNLDEHCAAATDCAGGICGADGLCDAPLGTDGVKNGDESDVDCGGTTTGALRCGTGKHCNGPDDCADGVCGGASTCSAPTYTDTVKNGNETDVDCGGDAVPAHACNVGKGCTLHTDCKSKGCDYAGKCAVRASCTAHDGGDTCLKADGTQESCCKAIAVPNSTYVGSAFTVDKYVTTTGRMRAFLTRVNGDVKGFITANPPAWWDPRWTPWLPQSFNGHVNGDYGAAVQSTVVTGWKSNEYTINADSKSVTPNAGVAAHAITVANANISSAWAQVGGGIIFDQNSQGCYLGTNGGGSGHPTYLVPKADAQAIYGDGYDRWIPQSALDQRPINCTNWPTLAALCAFDGGRLIAKKEYDYLYDDDGFATGGTTRSTYPWGTPPAMVCASGKVDKNGVCCKTNSVKADNTCTTGGGTWNPGAGYDGNTKPHPGGYNVVGGAWTKVGPGTQGFSGNPCPQCNDGFVNWNKTYQDPLYYPYDGNLTAAEQSRRAIDQSYFISVPGQFPLGASRTIAGDRVQDIAALMYEATLPTPGGANKNVLITFGNADPGDDFAAAIPDVLINGGSWEGHAVGNSTSYRLVTKYGKMTARCVY